MRSKIKTFAFLALLFPIAAALALPIALMAATTVIGLSSKRVTNAR